MTWREELERQVIALFDREGLWWDDARLREHVERIAAALAPHVVEREAFDALKRENVALRENRERDKTARVTGIAHTALKADTLRKRVADLTAEKFPASGGEPPAAVHGERADDSGAGRERWLTG